MSLSAVAVPVRKEPNKDTVITINAVFPHQSAEKMYRFEDLCVNPVRISFCLACEPAGTLLPGIFPEYPGNLPFGFRDIFRNNLPDNFVIYSKIVMNDSVYQSHDCFPGHFGMPVPDFIGNCCRSFTNLLYVYVQLHRLSVHEG